MNYTFAFVGAEIASVLSLALPGTCISYLDLVPFHYPKPNSPQGRMYGRSLLILAAIQGLALIVEHSYEDSIIFIWLCTFACGLQNSMTSKYSGNAVRTTHLTGASTDFGIALGHILKGRTGEWWRVQMHGA